MAARSKTACALRSRCTRPCARYGRSRSRSACACRPPTGSTAAGRPKKPWSLPRSSRSAAWTTWTCRPAGFDPQQKIPLAPGYQVPFAEKVKKESGITTMTVGLIAGYQQAEDIVASGKADLICLARAAIWDPRWAWHAAEELGAETPYAPKTMAGHPEAAAAAVPEAGAGGGLGARLHALDEFRESGELRLDGVPGRPDLSARACPCRTLSPHCRRTPPACRR